MDFAPLILFVDDDLLVVNKPSGLLSIPDGYDFDKPYLKGLLEPRYGKLWIVHRLDKETSGLVLLARNAEAHRHLNEQLASYSPYAAMAFMVLFVTIILTGHLFHRTHKETKHKT